MNTFKCWLVSQSESMASLVVLLGIIMINRKGGLGEVVPADHFVMSVWFFIVIFIVSLVLSIMIAIFTWKNFEEVISRSLIWRRSNVDRFSMKLKYSFAIFFQAFIISLALPYELSIMMLLF